MTTLLLMGIVLAYALLILHIDKCRDQHHKDGDEEALSLLAFKTECSVYDLFVKAGARWSFSKSKIDSDFNRYLSQGDIPHYLSSYVRRHCPDQLTYQDTLFTGNKLPPNANPDERP